jgi:hypothetical protein
MRAEREKREMLKARREYWAKNGTTTKARRQRKPPTPPARPAKVGASLSLPLVGTRSTKGNTRTMAKQPNLRDRLAAASSGADEEETDEGGGGDEPAPKKTRKPKEPAEKTPTTQAPRKNVAKGKAPEAAPLYLSAEPSPGAIEIPLAAPLHGRATRFLEAILSDE